MFTEGIGQDILMILLSYIYVGLVIFAASKMRRHTLFSEKAPRRFLHAMIGNLVFMVPFFASSACPVAVAAPFVFVTFLATPYSPFRRVGSKLKGLVAITEKGHRLGLVFYSISYTMLALLFASRPYVMAAGVLPMAYGDSIASLVGEKYGKMRYKAVADKSLEGSLAMLLVSLLSLIASLTFFSMLYPLHVVDYVLAVALAAGVSAVAEGFSPLGFDNLTVPLVGALAFFFAIGGL